MTIRNFILEDPHWIGHKLLIFALMGLFWTGCVTLEPDPKVPEVVADMPAEYPNAQVDGDIEDAYKPLRWWETFEDQQLNKLVDKALAANLDLVVAAERVNEVRAQLRGAKSSNFPTLTGAVDVAHTNRSEDSGRVGESTYGASVSMAYELDFWGRIRNDVRASLSEANATRADWVTTRLAVISETISTYFEIRDLQNQIGLTVEIIGVLAERVQQTDDRYERGLVGSFELTQIRQEYRNTQARLPQLEIQLASAKARLAVVLGGYTGHNVNGDENALVPRFNFTPIPPGLPADLLIQRPDVQSAAYQLEAARYRVGARRAALFPSLSLSGSLNSQQTSLSDLLNPWVINLGAGLTAPLFHGGKLKADVDVARAQYKQQAASYAKQVLTAFHEVAVAMERYEEENQRYQFFSAQEEEAIAAVQVQNRRYEAGLADYPAYLDALRTLYQVRTSFSAAERDLAFARLDVHRALGGGWTDEDVPAPEFSMIPRR